MTATLCVSAQDQHKISHTSHMTQVMACSMTACACIHTEYMALLTLEASCLAKGVMQDARGQAHTQDVCFVCNWYSLLVLSSAATL